MRAQRQRERKMASAVIDTLVVTVVGENSGIKILLLGAFDILAIDSHVELLQWLGERMTAKC